MSETKAPEPDFKALFMEMVERNRIVGARTIRAVRTLANALERAYTIGGDVLIDVGPHGAFAAYTAQTVLDATPTPRVLPAQDGGALTYSVKDAPEVLDCIVSGVAEIRRGGDLEIWLTTIESHARVLAHDLRAAAAPSPSPHAPLPPSASKGENK